MIEIRDGYVVSLSFWLHFALHVMAVSWLVTRVVVQNKVRVKVHKIGSHFIYLN